MDVVAGFDRLIDWTRHALLVVGVALVAVAAVDWAVRTRRISPFNRISRFFRARVDPLLVPVERVVVRGGGVPAAASWWSLVAYAVFGILLIALLGFLRDILFKIVALTQNPEEAFRIIPHWAISILMIALIIRVLSSWLPISPYSRWIRWTYPLTNWLLRPLQRIVPHVGRLDISPLVAWLILWIADAFIMS